MSSRVELQTKLEEILGSRNVYYQPPESINLQYPCIIYSLNQIRKVHADDIAYLKHKSYSVTIIDKNPDSLIPDTLDEAFLYSDFDRVYKADNLNHFVYTVYY